METPERLLISGLLQDDWKGYVPFEQMPSILNPESGTVSSANNRTVSDDYPYYISHSFDLPYRINRIRQMLSEKTILGVEDFKTMLADQHSDYARLVVPYILRLTDRQEGLTTLELQALDAIKDWDESYSVIPGGASGVPGSEYYLSQADAYLEGRFYKDHFTKEAVLSSTKHTLILKPGP